MDSRGLTPPRPPQRVNRWVWISLIVILGLFLLGRILSLSSRGKGFAAGDKVGIVRVEGPILSAEKTVADLEELATRSDIKAIVLRIVSPGGAIAPSQEIYHKVKSLRADKPVVASMGSVAASGGYYIALGSQRIVANEGTITGSIGVIMQYPVASDLLAKIGLSVETVKSGILKDAGSLSRPVTEQDREYFREVVADLHSQFVEAVITERNLSRGEVNKLADGRVYTGSQALALGLVDTLGTFEMATLLAAELAGIAGKPRTLELKKRRPSLLEFILGEPDLSTRNWFRGFPAILWQWE